MTRKDLTEVSLRNALMSQCLSDESDVIDRHVAAALLGFRSNIETVAQHRIWATP